MNMFAEHLSHTCSLERICSLCIYNLSDSCSKTTGALCYFRARLARQRDLCLQIPVINLIPPMEQVFKKLLG